MICLHAFGNLSGGKLCKCRKNQFHIAHVITQILGFKTFDVFMIFDRNPAPFLMNDIGENRISIKESLNQVLRNKIKNLGTQKNDFIELF